jgi:hypothetical protein
MRSMRSRRAALAAAFALCAASALAQTRGEPPVPTLGGTPPPPPIRIERPAPAPSTSAIDATVARQQRDQARRDLQAIEQRRDTFERTLTTPDRERLEPRLRELDALGDDARRRLRELDVELARPEPDQDRIRAQRERLERDIDRLELESGKLRTTP